MSVEANGPLTIWPRFPNCAAGNRIGLLGGSFNPAHDGHRQITLAALHRLQLDQVWWLVTPGNPLKDHAGLPSLRERMRQAHALANHPRIVVTGVEAELGTSFTARTLAHVRQRHLDVRFVWLMGADNLAQFHRWRDWQGIAEAMPIAVLDRPGWRWRALASPAAYWLQRRRWPEQDASGIVTAAAPAWVYLSIPLSTLSSTALRAGRNGGQT